MSNILKVTTPALGYENAVNKQNLGQPENIGVNPPVLKPDNSAGAGNREEFAGIEKRAGNLSGIKFCQFHPYVAGSSEDAGDRGKLLFGGTEQLMESGLRAQTADSISEMFQLLNMNAAEMTEFLKKQTHGANRLHGPLF